MEGETEERETLQLLVYLASLKPGAWNALHISHGGGGTRARGSPLLLSQAHWQGARVEVEQQDLSWHQVWNVDITGSCLTHCTTRLAPKYLLSIWRHSIYLLTD